VADGGLMAVNFKVPGGVSNNDVNAATCNAEGSRVQRLISDKVNDDVVSTTGSRKMMGRLGQHMSAIRSTTIIQRVSSIHRNLG
jgi:hypothetical protein